MNLVSKPTLFSAAIELLPKVAGKPLGELTDEEEKAVVATAARLARAMAKEFADGAWGPTIEPLPKLDVQEIPKIEGKNPEWIRMPSKGRCPYTGLSRSSLYTLVGDCEANGHRPPVKSIVLRKRGAARGVRLISYDSLMMYLRDEGRKSAG